MLTNEDLKTYSTCVCTIQNPSNFHEIEVSDHQLAKFVEFGMIEELQTAVDLWDLTKFTSSFKYHEFEQHCIKLYDSMVASQQITCKSKTTTTSTEKPSPSTTRLSDKDFVWKIHWHFESLGKCHFCKGYCGSPHHECKGPYHRKRVVFPPDYVAPPKPANDVPPRARSSAAVTQAGRL